MRRSINLQKFKNRTFAITSIVLLVALLLMLKPIAEKFKQLLGMIGLNATTEQVQETAGDIFTLAAGILLLVFGAAAAVLGVKVALIVTGIAVVGYAVYKIYNWVKSWPVFGASSTPDYGDTNIERD